MQPSLRLSVSVTFVSRYFNRAASIRRCSSIRSVDLDRAAATIDGCDYKHWLVVMDPPVGYPLRYQIVDRYIQTLASALGGEEEAKKSLYSVSTKYYYAFGCKIDGNHVIHTLKSMPNVRCVLPDSRISNSLGNKNYGGEPFIDGCVVPYDETFHEDWLQDRSDNGFRRRTRRKRSRRKEHKTDPA